MSFSVIYVSMLISLTKNHLNRVLKGSYKRVLRFLGGNIGVMMNVRNINCDDDCCLECWRLIYTDGLSFPSFIPSLLIGNVMQEMNACIIVQNYHGLFSFMYLWSVRVFTFDQNQVLIIWYILENTTCQFPINKASHYWMFVCQEQPASVYLSSKSNGCSPVKGN